VLDRIQPLISDYSNLYREVDVIQLNGTARAIVDGARPEAIWMEMCDPVEELAGAFEAVELDGFKVGGFIPVCNAILEDSMLDLASYVERTIAEAIAKAIDKAIMNGTGTKQPEGIVPNIVVGNKTTGETLAEILPSLGLVDTGEDQVGEIIAVMQRKTYYEKILPQTIATTDTGKQVVQGVNDPNIAGLRVVFSNYAPANKIILGDFKQYVLGERKGITLASSTDVRFIEDQTVFKGTARYDGKPVKKEAFAEVELVPGA
jgi:HK97 family phage major capsid protein